jgi:hypothetical protein
MCDGGASSTLTPLFEFVDHTNSPKNKKDKMREYALDRRRHKRIMAMIALCLVFATAVPVIVLAAG